MRIGILHRKDLSKIRALSGYPYFMAKALEEQFGEVVYLGPDGSLTTAVIEYAFRALNRAGYLLFKRRIASDHLRTLSQQLARTLGPCVAKSGCDAVFAPCASAEIAFLSTDIPIVYLSDLTWANIVDYYPAYTSLFEFARNEGEFIESAAIAKASALLYPSAWAVKTAVDHYKADPEKIRCVPWGANFEKFDIPPREEALGHSLDQGVELLWVGVDWERKGGPIAYDCLMELQTCGLNARLVVCGCVPPNRFRHPKIEVIPYLSKHNPGERRRLSQLYLTANFFLFPTVAEAYGIVLCEASAHGLPSLARDTGGVSGAVRDGENGYLLPPDAEGKHYAAKILEILQDRAKYDELVLNSRMAYEERLNWDAWGRAVKTVFERVAQREALETPAI